MKVTYKLHERSFLENFNLHFDKIAHQLTAINTGITGKSGVEPDLHFATHIPYDAWPVTPAQWLSVNNG